MGKISRRDFLKGSAVTGLGLATTALLGGCTTTDDNSGAGCDTTNETQTVIVNSAELNPQDESYDAYSGDVSAIFSPITVGPLQLRNRIVKAAAGSDTMPRGST